MLEKHPQALTSWLVFYCPSRFATPSLMVGLLPLPPADCLLLWEPSLTVGLLPRLLRVLPYGRASAVELLSRSFVLRRMWQTETIENLCVSDKRVKGAQCTVTVEFSLSARPTET